MPLYLKPAIELICIMTWVYWPLYSKEVVKKHGLVKDPNPGTLRLVEAGQLWVSKKVGFPRMLCCWVGDDTQLVYAAYLDYRERAYPPQKILPEGFMTEKQVCLLEQYMPLKDPGWYRHSDGSWSPWCGELWSETDRNPRDNLNSGIWIEDILAAAVEEKGEVGSDEEHGKERDDDGSEDEDTDEQSTEGSDDGGDEDTNTTTSL